ncbi:MAG: HypC/HybG/HupF family hydrogenase formation chaperone [Candidatus Omnitrophica bacterium]|nr:HypC/HybG/HupF family hydrogenase formation chaperone [Candidatus Omnitrophota bacterium]
MCLGIPMRVKKIKGDFAQVESGRLTRNINIQMLKRLEIGDYVIVHAGFAIEKVDQERAKETLRLINEIPLETFSKRAKGGF